jgi:hypothetical protein
MKQFVKHGSLLLERITPMAWERSHMVSVETLNGACMRLMKHGGYLAQRN